MKHIHPLLFYLYNIVIYHYYIRLACEWGPVGIRCNCVSPWYINTELAQQVLQKEDYKR